MVLIPNACAMRDGISTPELDDGTTFNRDADRRTNLAVLDEVIDEGFANRLERRVNETVRYSAIAQSADFSRM